MGNNAGSALWGTTQGLGQSPPPARFSLEEVKAQATPGEAPEGLGEDNTFYFLGSEPTSLLLSPNPSTPAKAASGQVWFSPFPKLPLLAPGGLTGGLSSAWAGRWLHLLADKQPGGQRPTFRRVPDSAQARVNWGFGEPRAARQAKLDCSGGRKECNSLAVQSSVSLLAAPTDQFLASLGGHTGSPPLARGPRALRLASPSRK